MAQLPPEVQLYRLANAFQLSRAVQTAARLKLGRLLGEGGRTLGELAAATGSEPSALLRFLRFLADIGVVAELADGGFGPTALSERLHEVDNLVQGEESWGVWGALPAALRTGGAVFAEVHGVPFYDYADRHPEQRAEWNAWNAAQVSSLAPQIAEALDLEGTELVVDVGGGEGALLAHILERHPGCRGILVDRPEVVAGAVVEAAGVSARCELWGGDAFESVPSGGDVYLLSRVLLNWDDSSAVALLRSCREAMGPESVLKVVEPLMPTPGEPRRPSLAASDLQLLLFWGGRHRTVHEVEELLRRAELRPLHRREGAPSDGECQVVEGARAASGER